LSLDWSEGPGICGFGAMVGAILETAVLSEIFKTLTHCDA